MQEPDIAQALPVHDRTAGLRGDRPPRQRVQCRELNLTRSAISHQLAVLEEMLGFVLTERIGRGIGLTLQGERYAGEARRVLKILQEASRWEDDDVTGRLTVSCASGLATYWLCQHIGDFQRQYPKLNLQLVSPPIRDDTRDEEVDLFIAYGTGDWPEQSVRQLITIRLFPVCSALFAHRIGGLHDPVQLTRLPLLHLVNHTDWRVWLAANGIHDLKMEGGIVFSDANFVHAAALAGQGIGIGIGIGDNMISGEALARGQLIRPFDVMIESPRAHYLVSWPEKTERPLGTDTLGRDVLSGLIYGVRISLLVGLVSTLIALLIGMPLGASAGY